MIREKIMAIFVVVIVAVICVNRNVYATNYCTICQAHLGCNNTGGRLNQTACPRGASYLTFTHKLKNLVLNTINANRNRIAKGFYNNLATARRMATVQWDDELAFTASLIIRNCRATQRLCIGTDRFPQAKNTFGFARDYSSQPDYPYLIQIITERFFSNASRTRMTAIRNHNFDLLYRSPNHLISMVANERQTHVGCAAVILPRALPRVLYSELMLACSFANYTEKGRPIYTIGPPCSGCTTGCNPDYAALCSESEQFSRLPLIPARL